MLKAQIIGNLGKDAEVKTTQSGQTLINFSVAHTVKTQNGDKTVWVNCTRFVPQGQNSNIAQYLKKGTKVWCEGEPSARAWINQSTGEANSSLELVVYQIELCGSAQPAATTAQQPATTQQPNYTINANGMQAAPPPPPAPAPAPTPQNTHGQVVNRHSWDSTLNAWIPVQAPPAANAQTQPPTADAPF